MTITVFAATDSTHGTELWATDGTSGRTALLLDIRPGVASSSPGNSGGFGQFSTPTRFAVLNNIAYFAADDGTHGNELWRTDGTVGGTVAVTDWAGSSGGIPNGYTPSNILVANNLVFFSGNGPSGFGLYTSTGVPGSTPTFVGVPVGGNSGIIASGSYVYWFSETGLSDSGLYGSNGAAPVKISGAHNGTGFVDVNGTGYFITSGGGGALPLQRISGTTATTVTGAPSGISNYLNVNGTLYFTAQNNNLYTTNPGVTTATLVKSVDTQTAGTSMAAAGSKLVSPAYTAAAGSEVYASDGSAAGTFMLKDILPGNPNFGLFTPPTPKNLTTVGNLVYFQDSDGKGGLDLWKTDGTTAGTVLVKHVVDGNVGASGIQQAPDFQNMRAQGSNLLIFTANDGLHGDELWRSDGTALGTMMIKDIMQAATVSTSIDTSITFSNATIGGQTYFLGSDQTNGNELWVADGTALGSHLLVDISPGFRNSNPTNLTLSGGLIYFTADDGVHGNELWVTDGSASGTHLVMDINPGSSGSSIFTMGAISGGRVVFAADDGVHGAEFWVSNGSAAGTSMVMDVNPGSTGGTPNSSSPYGFIAVNGNEFFTATTSTQGIELWVNDGISTHITKDINAGNSGSNINLTPSPGNNYWAILGTKVYFTADNGLTGPEMWVSDGTNPGTQIVKDLNTAAGTGSNPHGYVVANSKIFFLADNGGVNGVQLFSTDGTSANTAALTNTQWNTSLQTLTVTDNGKVFFTASAANGQELYVTTGAAPTLIDIVAGAVGSGASSLFSVGNRVAFLADNQTGHGTELWASDGTAIGTSMILDINPGAGNSNPGNFVLSNNKLFFTATDGTHGQELWVTDGTAANTHMVKDINVGAGDASIFNLKNAGTFVVFDANDGTNGTERYESDGTFAGTIRITNVSQDLSSTPLNFTSLPGSLDTGAETQNGTPNTDYLDGASGADILNGLAGDDVLSGGAANDTIDGGAGYDVAKYTGNAFTPVPQETYTYDQVTTQIVLTDTRGAAFDGTDTLTNVEQVNFLDGYVVFDTANVQTWQSHPVKLDSGGSEQDSFYKGDFNSVWENFVDTTNLSSTLWRTTHFDDQDNAISQLETLDNGTHMLTILDPNSLYSFATVVITYDSAWNQTNVTEQNDDASNTVRPSEIAAAYDSLVWYTTPFDPNGGAAVNQTFTGGNNSNVLFGFAGNDVLLGGAVNDVLNGGSGDDTLTGGTGDDKFVFRSGDGHDVITDFVAGAGSGDVISLHDYAAANFAAVQALMTQVGTSTVITFDSDNQIILQNVTLANLTAGDFVFV